MKRLALSGVVFLGALVFAGGGVGSAGAQAPPKVSIMVGGLEKIIYLPAMLTERLGYFKEAGGDVTLYNEGAGVSAEDEMLAGGGGGGGGLFHSFYHILSEGEYVGARLIFCPVSGGRPPVV